MTTLTGRTAGVRHAAAALCLTMIVCIAGAQAAPAAAAASAPTSAASGAGGHVDACLQNPKMCMALRVATQALIEAAEWDKKIPTACTLTITHTDCSASSPQPYVTIGSPSGNPVEVKRGQELLAWYLQNATCDTLCKPKRDVQACVQACANGTDPKTFPHAAASAVKSSRRSRKP